MKRMDTSNFTHSQLFANVVLPQLFHTSPAQFATYLNRDGTKFLEFYWNAAREQLPGPRRASSFGLNYRISEPAPRTQLMLITLPKPVINGESFYSALVYRPNRRILLITDMTRVFNLERTEDENSLPAALLMQITPRLERVEMLLLNKINATVFTETALAHLDD